MSSFTSKSKIGKAPKYFLLHGTAYEDVVPGANPEKPVNVAPKDRDGFYRHEAIRLSEKDLDEFNGAEGKPICFEHDPNHVVGTVRHSWLEADPKTGKRRLEIIAKVPLDDNGKKIKQAYEAGEIKGFSVGYTTQVGAGNHVKGKQFREISLVKDPFFPNCQLKSVSVAASATANTGK